MFNVKKKLKAMNILIDKMGQKLWWMQTVIDDGININIKSRVAQNFKLSFDSFKLIDIFLILDSEHTHLVIHFFDFGFQFGLLPEQHQLF